MMQVISGWRWLNKHIPLKEKLELKHQAQVLDLDCLNKGGFNFAPYRKHETVLITGDGNCLAQDVKSFEDLDIPHDVYCVNRSMLFFERPINHWGAVDCEESMWFTENVNSKIKPTGHRILRHSIGILPQGFDVFWRASSYAQMTAYGQHLWQGNSVFLAILSSINMGYKRLVLAGVPLDTNKHWYDPEGAEGPNWLGKVYRQWMDFKLKHSQADKVRSMGGYSAFILGAPDKEWFNGNGSRARR
jgi:hypothetical protein